MAKRFLYDRMTREQVYEVLSCFGAPIKKYDAGETVAIFPSDSMNDRAIGIILDGTAELSLFDSEGEAYFSQSYDGEGVFGPMFLGGSADDYYVIEAKTDCEVAYTDFERISEFCENVCPIHVNFSRNVYKLIAYQSQKDIKRLGIISKKTLRDKLLTYFASCAEESSSNEFNINITLSELSKYLCVDRSAMMREMKKLKDEGIIDSKGSYVILKLYVKSV